MHFRVACLVVLAILAAARGVPRAQENTPVSREYQIKAAILFNFVKSIEWPAEAFGDNRATLILGVLGEDPFGPALGSVDGRTVQGRTMVVRRFATLEELELCQVLFVSSSERDRLQAVFEALESWNVLTVGEMDRFAELGGIIGLEVRRNNIRFDINTRAGQQAGLSISSELLRKSESSFRTNGSLPPRSFIRPLTS